MNLRELLDIAINQLGGLTTLQTPDFRLEQAEYKKDEKIWDVVISYLVENTNKKISIVNPIFTEFQFHRIYKRLKIDENKNIVGVYMFSDKE